MRPIITPEINSHPNKQAAPRARTAAHPISHLHSDLQKIAKLKATSKCWLKELAFLFDSTG
jgi:hypothetical protein